MIRLAPMPGGLVSVAPAYSLGELTFRRYLDAVRGVASFDKPGRRHVARLDDLHRLLGSLERSGLKAEIDPALAAHLGTSHVPPPIDHERMFPFQRIGSRFMAERAAVKKSSLLADQMGLGKTVQAMCALPGGVPAIVVAPAGVKGVWRSEMRAWRPDYVVTVLQGGNSFRWPMRGNLVVTNYDILPHNCGRPLDGTYLIADEAHAVKNEDAARTHKMRALARAVAAFGGVSFPMTGTPLMNKPPELWTVLDVFGLAEEAFGSKKQYKAMFPGGWDSKSRDWAATPEVAECLRRVSLRRHRADVLPQLPEKIIREEIVEDLPADTVEKCDKLVALLRSHGIDLERADDAVTLAKIQEVAFTQISEVRAALAIAKLPHAARVAELFEQNGEPLVVFSVHRGPVDALGDRKGWATISGDVSSARRKEIEEEFQRGEHRGLSSTIGAGGVGITLTRAHQGLFVDLAWNPALNDQGEDRLCRIGQDRGVIITRLVADHVVDRWVTRVLTKKQVLINATVEASAVGGTV